MHRLSPPSGNLDGRVRIPGSKSYTNRALIISALADGESTLRHASFSDDSLILISALQTLGIRIREEIETLYISGTGGHIAPFKGELQLGAAGTCMRFMTALCATMQDSDIILSGTERMHKRPISDLVDALRSLGASIDYLGTDGCPPLRIRGTRHLKSRTSIPGNVSSQYFTALLLIAPLLPQGIQIDVVGKQISKSYIDMTAANMHSFGVTVKNDSYHSYHVQAGATYRPGTYFIEGDASGASYLFGLGALSNGGIRVENFNLQSAQGDAQFPRLLERMGCTITSGDENGGWVELRSAPRLKAIDVDMQLMPDTAQTLAVIAACAEGTSTLSGLSTLRIKETDRLLALQTELRKLGIASEIGDDFISVTGGSPQAATIATYDDHRMAMSFAILSARMPGMCIEDPGVVSKSFPEFWETLKSLGVQVEQIQG